ncbi:MAG TPA: CD225/dispanin family protein [Pyrinomonadaceae bacterium]|nr:CD225/dispanin family protein [Pyrinomonadaceae bacterium]
MSQDWTPPPASGTSENIPNYLVPAILSAICCFPLGIISIVFAAQVNGKVAAGDIQGAMDASKKAKLFSYIFLGLGIVGWVLSFIFGLVGGILGGMANV